MYCSRVELESRSSRRLEFPKFDVVFASHILRTVSNTIGFRIFLGYHFVGQGIYPKIVGKYLDICLCSIPTVGVYEK